MGHSRWSRVRRAAWIAVMVCALCATGIAVARVAHSSSSTTLSTERDFQYGKVLDTSTGRALYLFTKDPRGKSTCTGTCATAWPPLVARGHLTVARGSGLTAALLGTTRRRDGRLQVMYNHHPLYEYSQDHARGEVNGEGVKAFGAAWYLLRSSGGKVPCPAGYFPSKTGCSAGY